MKKYILSFLLTLGLVLGQAGLLMAQPATEGEALAVAENWIAAIIAKKGGWGEAESAVVQEITAFSRKGKQVGYFCKVSPSGYIIISLRKEMAPVKAYSATSELDPLSEEGMADLLKGSMERTLLKVRAAERVQAKGAVPVPMTSLFEVDYGPSWEALQQGDLKRIMMSPAVQKQNLLTPVLEDSVEGGTSTGVDGLNYVEGNVLLNSVWHQNSPYNNDCPDLGCVNPANGRALVGCVATAGAQIMRYWNWPPYGEGSSTSGGETVSHTDYYEWVNMADDATNASPAATQAAVAELSHEVGVAVGMNYGCNVSLANTYDMEYVFEDHYRYSTSFGGTGAVRRNRSDYTAADWFNLMKGEFGYNRPVQYRIGETNPEQWGHSIVGDGWQTIGGINQYHMNYGWGDGGANAWYTVDTLVNDPEGEEYLIEQIIPAPYLTTLSGTFSMESFRYRYFYRDTAGNSGNFAGGQFIQLLPGIVIECNGAPVRFENSTGNNTRLFTRGDIQRGIHMDYSATSAAIKLYNGGGIRFN